MANPIGVFGGIFDPVHHGHLSTAFLAAEHFHLDTIVFVPAGVAPHKRTSVIASSTDRLNMLRIALADEPAATIWDHEALRADVSYTVDTLDELRIAYPGSPLYFIVGADNLTEIRTWCRYRDILSKVTLCVTERPGYPMDIPPELSAADIRTFPSPLWGISSTMVRSYLSQGLHCKHLIPEGVRRYIFEYGIYPGIH